MSSVLLNTFAEVIAVEAKLLIPRCRHRLIAVSDVYATLRSLRSTASAGKPSSKESKLPRNRDVMVTIATTTTETSHGCIVTRNTRTQETLIETLMKRI